MEPIVVAPGVIVPAAALAMRAVRAGGPGGQNVNKVSSAVELRVELSQVTGLDGAARTRLGALAGRALDAQGRLLVESRLTRDQSRNLDDAREKVRALVARALVVPKRRRKTRPGRGAVERRLDEKKRAGQRKRDRRERPE